jgi:Rieske Fe-S protein
MDTPCAGCSRRSFLSASVLGAVGALLASACGDGVIGSGSVTGPSTSTGSPLGITLADYPALANIGGIARINGLSVPVAVVRTGAATYEALSLRCPHQGTTVSIVTGGFRCPNHRATFSANGTWTGGQPTRSLSVIASTYDATTGTLQLV